jgi:hypothetical protein
LYPRPCPTTEQAPIVRFRHFWGKTKRADLVKSLEVEDFNGQYTCVTPQASTRYTFRPLDLSDRYLQWPLVTELCSYPPQNGLMEKRGGALFDMDHEALVKRMQMYYDPDVSWAQLEALGTGLTRDAARFDAREARAKVIDAEAYAPDHLRRYLLRPFDVRWCYYSGVRPLWNEPRPALWAQCWKGNTFFMTRPAGVARPEGVPVYFTSLLGDNDFQRGHAYYFPVHIKAPLPSNGNHQQSNMLSESGIGYTIPPKANLSDKARGYLNDLGIRKPDTDTETASLIWLHALAIGYAPAYRAENADGIRADWPRVPLPASAERLRASAALGRRIAALLDTMPPGTGAKSVNNRTGAESFGSRIGTGSINEHLDSLSTIGALSHVEGRQLNPTTDLAVTAGWGYTVRETVTMPGQGDAREREYTPAERDALASSAEAYGLSFDEIFDVWGHTTYDVYLNAIAYWCNIPAAVWEYVIGGYQVIKKWLAYREHSVMGRALTPTEASYVTHTARRLAEIMGMQPDLDANYRAVKRALYDW